MAEIVYAKHGFGIDAYTGAFVPTTFIYRDEAMEWFVAWVRGLKQDGEVWGGKTLRLIEPAMCFHVIAHRSPASILGAASLPLKGRDGQPQPFASYEDALEEARRLNRTTTTPNVHYTADPEPHPLIRAKAG